MLNLKDIEERIRKFWEEKEIIKKLIDYSLNSHKPKFYLLDGPPYVNAEPHVGHVKTRVFKDIWNKYMLMNGYFCWFQPGFDCHGLPIENMVEKELGLKSKKDIEKLGVDRFIEECRKKAKGNEKIWIELYKRIGDWRGYFEPYMTMENYYIESAWWTIKEMWKKGMLYLGEKPTYWCPHCETSLSGYEVTDSYADVKDPYILVKFPIKGKTNEYLVIFTTTPWTLVSNVAIIVKGDEYYVKVSYKNEKLIIAEKRLQAIQDLLKTKFKVEEKFLGKELEGLEYEPVLNVNVQRKLDNNKKARRVYLSIPVLKSKSYKHGILKNLESMKEEFFDFVNIDEGTGLVHCAPGHGPEDYYLAQHYGLPVLSPVDDEGKFTEEADNFSGIFVKEADKLIIEELEKNGYLLYKGFVIHSYPLCWRCKSPLIFRLTKQWFLSVDKIKEKMIDENEKVRWLPPFGKERFKNWLKDAIDWCISRQRYWGIPLPIWICEKCGNVDVIGSYNELKAKARENLPERIDLHKNEVDKIILVCNKCNGDMKRVPDVLDVWFDSGIAPWASLGYPYKNKDLFERLWKVDLVNESQDQIRGWFYSLMFVGVAIFGEAPYKSVAVNGWVLDEKGEKMSKSLGNVIWAFDAVEKLGADVIRLYFCWENSPWEQQNFSFTNAEIVKRHLNIFWNILNFYRIYSKNLKFTLENLKVEDKWILSRLNTTIKHVRKNIENFEFEKAGRLIIDFIVEDLSRTYIKIVRDRVSLTSDERDIPLSIIKVCLVEVSKMLAPITPFLSEEIYQILEGKYEKSVFEEEYPKENEKLIDKELEEKFKIAKEFIEAILSIRQENKIRLKWLLKTVFIPIDVGEVKEIIKVLGNVKEVRIGENFNLPSKETKFGRVYLDINLYEDLKEESIIREFVRAVQEERKKRNMNVWEKIKLKVSGDREILKIIEKYKEEIANKVGAEEIILGRGGTNKIEVFNLKILFEF